jgi:CheY-like chemotaxis protein
MLTMKNNSAIGNYILLAEDDPDDCMLFTDAFNEVSLNLELAVVNDGVQLLQFLSKEVKLPQIIFLDLNMPLKKGFECLKELKESEKLKNIPVIIYSTSASPTDIEKSKQLKAHLYVTKPNSFIQLKKVIQRVLIMDFVKNLTPNTTEKFLVFSEND